MDILERMREAAARQSGNSPQLAATRRNSPPDADERREVPQPAGDRPRSSGEPPAAEPCPICSWPAIWRDPSRQWWCVECFPPPRRVMMREHRLLVIGSAGEPAWEDATILAAGGEWDWWKQISETDMKYAREKPNQSSCVWCGMRTGHSESCRELHRSWSRVLPFGKYRGMQLADAPPDYLKWIIKNSSNAELVEESKHVLSLA